MARKTKGAKASKPTDKEADSTVVGIHGISGEDLVEMLNRRITESKGFWDGDSNYKLDKVTKENEKLYLGRQVSDSDEDDENKHLDNRIFTSIRTIVPYVTTRITEPEVYPSSKSTEGKKFAEDFEKALHVKADMEQVDAKMRFAVEDAIVRRRGYLKPRYDAANKNFCAIEFIPCESIVVDHKAKPFEEPRYFRHYLEKSVEDLLVMFPSREAAIRRVFKLPANPTRAELEETHTINEDWLFVKDENNELDLVVCWNYKELPLWVIQDPNWNYEGDNFLKHHTMPLVPVNVLSDGRTWIDKTSYVEQAKYLQKTIDDRAAQISKNAGLGNVGMPVVDSKALADDQAQFMQFEPDTVIELDVENAGGTSINDVFTTWKAGTLSPDVYKDKQDATAGVQNTFGASNVFQGQESNNNTLGQDELLRDQSMGRQQEIVTAIDNATSRLYPLIAQFLLIYGDEQELFPFVGENGEFDYIMMNTAELDTKCIIRIKSGTSMPIDKPQRRATADKAASQSMIDPLSYWEIMDEPNAQKYAKRLMDYTADPASFLQDVDEEVFDRDAFVDIEILKRGEQPEYRDDLSKEYFDYLNHFIVSGNLENPKIAPKIAQAISAFIDTQLARGQKMLGMAETQLPTEQDVTAYNKQVDESNTAAAEAPQPAATEPVAAIE